MSAAATLRTALRLWDDSMRLRGAGLAILALGERLLAPGAAYILATGGTVRALPFGVALSAIFAARGVAQRSAVARSEARLYWRAVGGVLEGDVLQASVLPDEEARGGLFEGLHRVAVLLSDTLPNLVANAIAAVLLGVVATVMLPARVSGVAALALGFGALALFGSRRWIDRAQTDAWRRWDGVSEGVTDACDGRLDIVASGTQQDFLARFEATTNAWDIAARRAGRVAGMLGRLPVASLAVAIAAAVVIDALLAGSTWTTAVLRAGLLGSCTPAFLGLARCLQELVSNEPRLRLVANIIGDSRLARLDATVPPPAPARVEFREVSFAYERCTRETLRGVTFTWSRGELLAIAGPNGSGKTTCLRALLGFGEPTRGAVLVDGVPLARLDLERWRRTIAFLPQRPYLPPRATVRDSLRFLDRDLDDDSLSRALEQVGLLERLGRLEPDPLAVRVGVLSMGERQRIALARVLCRDAPLLVLDEPDANLDRDGVKLVARQIARLSGKRMVLVVAHTPELLDVADRIVTLEAGSVGADVTRRAAARVG